MRFKIDENLPAEVEDLFRRAGFDAITVGAQQLQGYPDDLIAKVCRQEKRALITLDLDFADIRAYPPNDYSGLVILRLQRQDKPRVLHLIQQMISLIGKEQLEGRMWIIEEDVIRIREG